MLTIIVTGERVSGKTTLAKKLERFLQEEGYDVVFDESHYTRRKLFEEFQVREENDGRKVGLVDDSLSRLAYYRVREQSDKPVCKSCCSRRTAVSV